MIFPFSGIPADPLMRHILFCTLVLCLGIPVFGAAGEQPPATPVQPPAAGIPAPIQGDERSLLMRETKQYVAELTEERNRLRSTNETLGTRQGLLIGYGVVMTLLAAWLMMRVLTKPVVAARSEEPDTDAFPAGGTTATLRKNATITIRNGATQQAEMTDQVQTRHAFARSETTAQHRRPITNSIVRSQMTTMPSNPPAGTVSEAEPTRPAAPTPALVPNRSRATATHQRVTVRVEQASDRLAPVDVAVKPGTAPVHRSSGRTTET